jgi:hypothetical protein
MRRAGRLLLLLFILCAAAAVSAVLFTPGASAKEKASTSSFAGRSDVAGVGKDVTIGDHRGDVFLVGGDLRVEGRVNGDVLTVGTNVSFGEQGYVSGDFVGFGGAINGLTAEKVGGDAVARPKEGVGAIHGDASILTGWREPFSLLSIAVQFSLLVVWFVAAVVLSLIMPREIRSGSLELRTGLLHHFILGLVGFTSFVLTAVVFSYLVPYLVGIPLLLFLGALGVVVKVFGMMAVFHLVGSVLFAAHSREELGKRGWIRGDLALTIAGLIVLGLLRLIPVVGTAIWMTASVLGIGAALSTRFGRRDPWFLAVRTPAY